MYSITAVGRKSYTCYHWTEDDKKNIATRSHSIQDYCEKNLNFRWTRGDDSKAPGCGPCYCCKPIQGKRMVFGREIQSSAKSTLYLNKRFFILTILCLCCWEPSTNSIQRRLTVKCSLRPYVLISFLCLHVFYPKNK